MVPNDAVRPLGVPPDRRVLIVEDDVDISDSMCGVIEVTSEVGRGSVFTVRLPAAN
jgi:hypothetical protein